MLPDDNRIVHFPTRGRNDLPKEIKGKATWGRYKDQESAYFVALGDGNHAVEFINDQWYWVEWYANAHAYRSSCDRFVRDPAKYGLGTKENPYLSPEDAERLNKASTSKLPESEGEEESNAAEPPTRQSEDIPIGNRSDDEDLATQVGAKMSTTTVAYARGGGVITLPLENPMQPPSAIAQEVEYQQKGKEPERPYGRPPGDIQGGGGGDGGDPPPGDDGGGDDHNYGEDDGPAGNNPAPGLPHFGIPTTRTLAGSVTTFDGDRSKSIDFEKEFGIYRLLNASHPMIRVPMQRVALALSFIKGEKVNQWTYTMANWLAEQVYRTHDPVHPGNERLWNEFAVAFRRQYGDTALMQRSWARLQKLEMEKDDIDQYIAEFENLIMLAGKDRNDSMSVDYFRSGLKAGLQNVVLNRRPVPRTLDDWQAMAREEVEINTMKKASLGARPKFWLSSRESLWQDTTKVHTQSKQKKRDPNAMDIDVVRTSNVPPEERQTLMKEGRCFFCKEKGH